MGKTLDLKEDLDLKEEYIFCLLNVGISFHEIQTESVVVTGTKFESTTSWFVDQQSFPVWING